MSRVALRPGADLYEFNLRDCLPVFPLPLLEGDQEPLIDLETLLDEVYKEAALALAIWLDQRFAIDYAVPPKIKLKEEDWVCSLLI